jgi:protein translocase SecG subunit
MDLDEQKRLAKRALIVGGLFALAVIFFRLQSRGLLIAYVLMVGVLLVLAILLQSSKGGGLASLGGLGGDSLLGTRSATPIAKATYVMGALLLFICMLLARLGVPQQTAPVGAIGREEPAQTVPINVDSSRRTGQPAGQDAGTPVAPAEGAGQQGGEAPSPTTQP